MSDFAPLAIGVAIPVIALAAKYFIEEFLSHREKEVLVQSANGKEERISINANATSAQVINAVVSAMEFERDIAKAIEAIGTRKHLMMKYHQGKGVDFIIEYPDHKLAIEVKNSIERVTSDQIDKYLASEPNLNRLILVSRQPASLKIRREFDALAKRGRLTFLPITNIGKVETDLENALGGKEAFVDA